MENATAVMKQIVELLHTLTDEQRTSVFEEFCIYCGSTSLPCYCWDDE